MSSDEEAQSDSGIPPETGESGLFSQLPRTRPGVRSPRRGEKEGKPRTADRKKPMPAALRASEAAADARDAAGFDPLDPPPAPVEEAPLATDPPPEPEHDFDDEGEQPRSLSPASLEDLAWAGVAVTAEAATLGVRLLGRAVDAARRATERS